MFTRNVVGSADFTPTALPVAGIDATHGFMLGTSIYIESGLVHFAENVNVYEGYAGLSLMNDIPVSWDETIVLEGKPGEYGTVVRCAESDWYMAALTSQARKVEISLTFLEDDASYTAYIYKTNSAGNNIEVVTKEVTSKDVFTIEFANSDGCAVKFTTKEFDYVTGYEKEYLYLEGENTIAFYNDEAFAPNLDRISLSKKVVDAQASVSDEEKDVVVVSPGANYTYHLYEAEDGILANGATNEGTLVGWLEGTAYLELNNIEVEKAGTYYVQIWYMTGEDRTVYLSVNGGENIAVECPSSGDYYSNPACAYVEIELEAGVNTIRLSNPDGYAPNLDKIGISK